MVYESFYLSWCVDPGKMTEVRISGNADHFCIECLELSDFITECDNLSWADKGAEGKIKEYFI